MHGERERDNHNIYLQEFLLKMFGLLFQASGDGGKFGISLLESFNLLFQWLFIILFSFL